MSSLARQLARHASRTLASAREYHLRLLGRDAVAGLSVAVVAIPQSMAYALVAGVPVQYGLYTLVIQSLVGTALSASRFISVGPVNTQSLLVASVVSHAIGSMNALPVAEQGQLYLQLVLGLTVLKGLAQLLMAAARMGRLVKYISHSVIVGFTSGAGLLIVAGQVPNFLGLDLGDAPRHLPGLLGTIERTLPHLEAVNLRSALVGTATLVLILLLVPLSKKRLIPGPFLAVCAAGAAVWLLGWTDADLLLISPFTSDWPPLSLPVLELRQWESLLGGAVALGLLGLLETYSIGKSLMAQTGQRVNANQELAAQGAINFLSGLVSCIPGSGSFSRSALNVSAGAATRLSGALCGLVTVIVMAFLVPAARYVPLASLAAVLFVIGVSLVDLRYLRDVLRADRADAAVCLVTLAATLTVPLQYAIFTGVFLNVAIYLQRTSRLQLKQMVPTEEGPFQEKPVECGRREPQDVVFLQLEGDLFFGLADELGDCLSMLAESGVRVVIFQLKRTHYVDATVLKALDHFVRDLQGRGGAVLLCGIRPSLMDKLRAFGLVDLIGPENVFAASHGIFASAKQAMARAATLAERGRDEG